MLIVLLVHALDTSSENHSIQLGSSIDILDFQRQSFLAYAAANLYNTFLKNHIILKAACINLGNI